MSPSHPFCHPTGYPHDPAPTRSSGCGGYPTSQPKHIPTTTSKQPILPTPHPRTGSAHPPPPACRMSRTLANEAHCIVFRTHVAPRHTSYLPRQTVPAVPLPPHTPAHVFWDIQGHWITLINVIQPMAVLARVKSFHIKPGGSASLQTVLEPAPAGSLQPHPSLITY